VSKLAIMAANTASAFMSLHPAVDTIGYR
jgi:hypothetical protein